MISVGVFEDEAFTFSKALLRLTKCALITNPKNARLDIALVSGNLCRKPDIITSELVIVPDSLDRDLLSAFCAKNLISYGLCRKNTVTASSLVKSRLAISLQRKMADIYGKVIEEQEMIISLKETEQPEDALGLVSALLALGIAPERISKMNLGF